MNQDDPIPTLLAQVDAERMRRGLFYLAKDPLPFRKLNYTLPGHSKSTLHEADDYIQAQLESWGYVVEREAVRVQAFRCDRSKPPSRQWSAAHAGDLWYTAYNLYARKSGIADAEKIVLLVAHKDSQSWIDSPGAYDNAVGAVGVLEMARVLRPYQAHCSICFLFCNEEHAPWTSVAAAKHARARGDDIVALFNTDGLGGKGPAEIAAGRKTNVTRYSALEGKWLADLMAQVNETYRIGLEQSAYYDPRPGDDDGSFINEGYLSAVANLGSLPYADPNYHLETDRPEAVDMENVAMAVKAILAAVVKVVSG